MSRRGKLVKIMNKLTFGSGNKKLNQSIATFSLPAGYSCPGADVCLTRFSPEKGKIIDGPNKLFRCYAASEEAVYSSVRSARWNNFNVLVNKTTQEMMNTLCQNLFFVDENIVRVHVSGDYFNQNYFDAWMAAARMFPKKIFYSYTKSIPYWIARLGEIPPNFRLIASKGGKFDSLIAKYNLRFAEVVFSAQEAKQKKLRIDKTDRIAIFCKENFALLLHGTQPVNSAAGEALKLIRRKERKAAQRNISKFQLTIN